mgnify:CR=1 FL=1
MKFRYFKFPLPERSPFFGVSILKPIIPLGIAVRETSLQYAALIDSGADFCIFDAEIGEALGLDVRSGTRTSFGGIQETHPADAFLHEVTLVIGGWHHTTTVGFSYGIAQHGYGILGQKGFFDIFIVKFDLLKEEIELKERPQPH